VIGVDPGTSVTGFGIVEKNSQHFRFLEAGVVRTQPRSSKADRLLQIFERLTGVIEQFQPAIMSLERSFVGENVQSAFRLGEARGVAMLAAACGGLDVFEYDPTSVKLAVASYGRADKQQVKMMVRRTLTLSDAVDLADDASDALALAICHLGVASMPIAPPARNRASAAEWRR